MFVKLKKKYNDFNLSNLNNMLLVLSLIVFIISLVLVKNNFIFILIYLFVYLTKKKLKNKTIRFISDISGIILVCLILISYLELSIFSLDIKYLIRLVLKVLLGLDYFFIIISIIKNKKIKYVKGRKSKKYTFKELRSKKFGMFKAKTQEEFNKYIKNENINIDSDYYQVIQNNLENKSKNDLEEYVWLNYLRFYKNKRFNKRNVFDRSNLLFLVIHIIILLLTIFVR